MSIKIRAKKVLNRFGYDLSRLNKVGVDPFADMRRVLPGTRLIFDIGANVGQSARRFRQTFPLAEIHSFEPCQRSFAQLQCATASDQRIKVWNCALGALPGCQLLYDYGDQSDLNSLLPASTDFWAKASAQVEVQVRTIDGLRAEEQLPPIDVLKSDTQGYDLNVLRGAMQSLQQDVRMVYLEVNFARLYEAQGSFGEQFELLTSAGFHLFSLYNMFRVDGLAGWTDALFVHRSLLPLNLRLRD